MSMSNNEVFCGGATTSQHVDAQDDDHFENTTFKLKRTRSMGLLDEFIPEKLAAAASSTTTNTADQNTDHIASTTNTSSNVSHSTDLSSLAHQLSIDSNIINAGGENDIINIENNIISNNADSSIDSDAISPPVSSVSPGLTPTPLSLKSPELLPHDDTDITTEPSVHVDYLSHQWDVSDILRSWRYVILKRKDVANSARLENASWRTWAQRRCNLKTISPEVVNWSKDSDVTWLYGPILKDDKPLYPDSTSDHKAITTASSVVAGDISIPNKSHVLAPKPILKRRTVQDMMISHLNLLKLQLATNKMYQKQREKQLLIQQQQQHQQKQHIQDGKSKHTPEFDDYDAILAKLNSQYKNVSGSSENSSQNSSVTRLQSLLQKSQGSTSNLKHQPQTPDFGPALLAKDVDEADFSMFLGTSSSAAAATAAISIANAVPEKAKSPIVEVPGNVGSSISVSATGTGTVTSASTSSSDSVTIPVTEEKHKEKRHIHFNDEVTQCIAVDHFSDNEYEEEDDDYYYDPDTGSEDEFDGYIYENSTNYGENVESTPAYNSDEDDDDEDDDDEDEEGGFFLKVKSPSIPQSNIPGLLASAGGQISSQREPEATEDSDSVSTNNSKLYKTIQLLPSTSLNYGSDEESDEENPYTSSLSHNVNNDVSRGYDYYYDYNTVYTVDPSHAIYGTNKKDTPDVVDVPENITMGSNFDYEIIENDDFALNIDGRNALPIINPAIINSNNINNQNINQNTASYVQYNASANAGSPASPPTIPIPKAAPSAIPSSISGTSPFSLSDSENSDDESDEGLSIGARTSSHSLAQQVFGQAMSESVSNNSAKRHFPEAFETPQPSSAPVSSINPNHSSASISKMPTSSSSLSQLFFGGAALTKQRQSSNSLSEQFFNAQPTTPASILQPQPQHQATDVGSSQWFTVSPESSPAPLQKTLSNTQRKASPLPPHTTSANAFLGNTTPPPLQPPTGLTSRQQSKTFLFDDSDSDSDVDYVENVAPLNVAGPGANSPSYATLALVADKSGVKSPSPDVSNANENNDNQSPQSRNIVGQAKGLANHFLGGWKQ